MGKNTTLSILLFILFIHLPYFEEAHADIEMAVGLITPYSGRLTPSPVLGYSNSSFALLGFSSGVKTKYYFESTYGLAVYKMWSSGEFLGGKINSGLGLGGLYSRRGFQDLDSQYTESKDDYLLGPAFKVNSTYLGFFYYGIDVIIGLRDIYRHLTLNYQDVAIFQVGVKL